jgi:hypothetical protein
MKTMDYRLKSKPIRIVNIPEKYKIEAGRLVDMVSEIKHPLGLLELNLDEEYPLLRDMQIFTQAQLLVETPSSKEHLPKERLQELYDELFIKTYKKLKEEDIKVAKEREERNSRIEQALKDIYKRANYSSNRTYRSDLK